MYMLHINGWTPPALAVAIALAEKDLAFETVEHDWRDSADALAAFASELEPLNSLEGELPILVADGVALSDSYFILEYLDDRHPEPALRPADAYGQWQLQALARFFGERALPSVASLGVASRFGGREFAADVSSRFANAETITAERRDTWQAALTDPANAGAIAESNRKLALLFERLDKALGEGGAWLLGADFTLADIEAYVLIDPFVSGLLRADAEPPASVREWHARVGARPAVRDALAGKVRTFLPGPEHARWG